MLFWKGNRLVTDYSFGDFSANCLPRTRSRSLQTLLDLPFVCPNNVLAAL